MSSSKNIFIAFTFLLVSITSVARQQTVNSILGDLSYVQKFGRTPNENTNEQIRIQTHLEFVESILRRRDVSKMPKALRENRNKMLNILHGYWIRAEFPVNYDYAGMRIPCFIDKDSRICAVGYLIEKTAGRAVAEKINTDFKYADIFEMKDPLVENWIASSGLTKLECAMIQPTYEYRNYQEPLAPSPPFLIDVPITQPIPPLSPAPPSHVCSNRNERALKKGMDSLLVVTHSQNLKLDSLQSELKVLTSDLDSIENLSQQKDQELEKLKGDTLQSTKFLTTVIWVLSILIGFSAFMFALKLLSSKKV
jgi:hypothetical protein